MMDYRQEAIDFCNGMEKKVFYAVDGNFENHDDVTRYVALTDEQVEHVRQLMDDPEWKGASLWEILEGDELEEVIEKPSDLWGYFEASDMDFTPRHMYTFSCMEVRQDGKPWVMDVLVELTEEEYASLLEKAMCEGGYTMEMLFYDNFDLYKKIKRGAISMLPVIPLSPVAIAMKEVEEDAKAWRESKKGSDIKEED